MNRADMSRQSVVRIASETLIEFIRRVGVVNTENVRMRFGWDYRQARRHLDELERKGLVRRCGLKANHDYGGSRLEWEAR